MKATHLLLPLLLASSSFLPAAEPDRPNIVYFLVDDMGYADVGFNGCKDIHTPNIDKLAKQGAVLDSFYAQPVCSPGRAALMTGRYPMHTGIYNVVNPQGTGLRGPLPLAERTLAEALHAAGYTTAISGKWHLGSDAPEYMPRRRGFDSQYGLMGGAINYFTHAAGDKKIGALDWWRNDIASEDTGYSTHLIAQEACRIIRAQPADKPLFLYVAPNAVHGPLDSPEEYKKPYAGMANKSRLELAGATAALDDDIGKIVAALDEKGMRQNTLIVFSSDNGGPSWNKSCSNGPLRGGKSDIYEGGVRVCAFATWPGKIPAGIHIQEPLHVVDWFPTLCRLAGASVKQELPLDGMDIWPVLTQGAKSPHEAIPLIGSRDGQYAIRVGDWKLLINPAEFKRNVKCSPVELYNLAEDMGEKQNLADAQPGRVKEMRARLDALIDNAIHSEFFNPKRAGRGKEEAASSDNDSAKPDPMGKEDMAYSDNGTIKIGIDRTKGGAITWLSWNAYSSSAVNVSDPGRLIQQSYYAGRPLDRRADGQSKSWSPWPWNPIQGGGIGSWARITEFKRLDAGTLYAETVPKLWDMPERGSRRADAPVDGLRTADV